MGAPGEDLLFSPAARRVYPCQVECKNVEKLNIWAAIEQAREHGNNRPLVAFKKNGQTPFVAIEMEWFLELVKKYNEDTL